jgi:hypothetical protein
MPKVPDSIASSLQHDEDIPCSGIKLVHEAHYRIDITVSIRPVTRPSNGWSSNGLLDIGKNTRAQTGRDVRRANMVFPGRLLRWQDCASIGLPSAQDSGGRT